MESASKSDFNTNWTIHMMQDLSLDKKLLGTWVSLILLYVNIYSHKEFFLPNYKLFHHPRTVDLLSLLGNLIIIKYIYFFHFLEQSSLDISHSTLNFIGS